METRKLLGELKHATKVLKVLLKVSMENDHHTNFVSFGIISKKLGKKLLIFNARYKKTSLGFGKNILKISLRLRLMTHPFFIFAFLSITKSK